MSWASTPGVRRSMKSNRSSGTRPELRVRRALHAAGLRFNVQVRVPSAPRRRMNVAFPRLRIAIYVDGCFWHACTVHPFKPTRHGAYWDAKFAANRARDRATTELLEQQGWLVLRFWEHEAIDDVVARVSDAVRHRRSALLHFKNPRPEGRTTSMASRR